MIHSETARFAVSCRLQLKEIGQHFQPSDMFPGSKYAKMHLARAWLQTHFLMYLDPREHVWWLQMSFSPAEGANSQICGMGETPEKINFWLQLW